MTTWIGTLTGRRVDLVHPDPATIRIEDIACGLAQCNRFAGQTKIPYSVAEHSVRMYEIAPPELKLEALMHDASEAYLGDVPKPLKNILPDYRAAEARMTIAIRKAFGLPGDKHPPELKYYDRQMMATEARDFGRDYWSEIYPDDPEPLAEVIVPWDWQKARHEFMATYYRIMYAETS